MSRPRPDAPNGVSSIASAAVTTCSASAPNFEATTTSVGSTIVDAELLRLGEVAAHGVDLVGLEQARADLVALGREEGEEHAAADEQRVDPRQQVPDDAELVGDLRAAEHDRVRLLGRLGEPVEHVELGGDEQPGGARQQLARARRRSPACGARRRSRRRRRRRRTRRARRRTPRARPSSFEVSPALKRRFSSTSDLAVAERRDASPRHPRRRCRSANATGAPSSSPSRRATGARLYFGSGAPSGRPRWETTIDAGARAEQGLERGERRPHAAVVRDAPVLQRDVEVAADDDALAGERPRDSIVRSVTMCSIQRRSATYSVRSTRRLE